MIFVWGMTRLGCFLRNLLVFRNTAGSKCNAIILPSRDHTLVVFSAGPKVKRAEVPSCRL